MKNLLLISMLLSVPAFATPEATTAALERELPKSTEVGIPDVVTFVGGTEVIPADVTKPNVGLSLLAALQDVIAAGLIGLLGMLAAFLRSKQTESKAARIGLVVTEAARAAVLELDATIKPKLKAYLADGVLSDEEKADLKRIAMDLLKTKLPGGLLKGAADVFGAAFLDTYLGGKIEQAVIEKNSFDRPAPVAAAAPTASPLPA